MFTVMHLRYIALCNTVALCNIHSVYILVCPMFRYVHVSSSEKANVSSCGWIHTDNGNLKAGKHSSRHFKRTSAMGNLPV